MSILDGVIFARSEDGWEPHTIKSGPNKGGNVERKKRSSGRGYQYREAKNQPRSSATLSDASRMVLDPDFNWRDPVARGILRDALLDEGRDREVALVDGPYFQTVVIDEHGRMDEPHEMPNRVVLANVRRELQRLGGDSAGFSSVQMAWDFAPAGSVHLHYPEKILREYFEEDRLAIYADFPAAALLHAVRSMRLDETATDLNSLRGRMNEFLEQNLPRQQEFFNLSDSIRWGHFRCSRLEKDYPDVVDPNTVYSLRSMAVVRTDGQPSVRGYYFQGISQGDSRLFVHPRTRRELYVSASEAKDRVLGYDPDEGEEIYGDGHHEHH